MDRSGRPISTSKRPTSGRATSGTGMIPGDLPMRRQFTAALQRVAHPEVWRHVDDLLRFERLEAADAEGVHDAKLAAVLRHAVECVPRYRALAQAQGWRPGDLTAASLTEFPRVDKKILTDLQAEHLADDAAVGDRVPDATGGSSGVWFGFFYDHRTKEIRRATHVYSRLVGGWRPGDPFAVVWGHRGDVAATEGVKRRIIDSVLFRQKTLNAYDMDDELLEAYTRRLESHRPRLLVGYASSLVFLARYLGRRGRHTIRPVGIVSSAETLDDEMRAIIEGEFGCKVYNRYGSREFANIAQQCEECGGLHVFSNRIHVEILRPDGTACDPGESGEIVITDLINGVMPFIRYRTGDMGTLAAEPCACGRSMPVLARVEGRVSEIIVGKNGKYYSCQSPRLFGADIPGIEQMQVIQDSLDLIEVKIVPGPAWSQASEQLLVDRMKGLLGDTQVHITPVEHIPPAPSGKYRFTISSVSPFSA